MENEEETPEVEETPVEPEAEETPVEPGTTEVEETTNEPAAVEEPVFDWDAWDGEVDSAPETYREVVAKAKGRYTKDADNWRSKYEAERTTLKLYEEWMNSEEYKATDEYRSLHPELVQTRAERDAAKAAQAEYEAKLAEYEARSNDAIAEATALRQAIEAQEAAKIEREHIEFREKNKEMLENPALRKATIDLLTDENVEWDLQVIPKLVTLNEKDRARVIELVTKEKVPQKYALDLIKPQPLQAEPGTFPKKVLNAPGKVTRPKATKEASSLDEAIELAIGNALKT